MLGAYNDYHFLQYDRVRRDRLKAERYVVHFLINFLFEILTQKQL